MQVKLTIYVAQVTPAIDAEFNQLRAALEQSYPGDYELSIVNVLEMPEKAIEREVFVTPTVIRELPEPVLRILGDLSDHRTILTAIELDGEKGSVLI